MTTIWLIVFLINITTPLARSAFGPPYPITAAVFKGRNSTNDWVKVIGNFQKQGGDTIILRAAPLVIRSKESLDSDPDFKSCGSSSGETSCYEAVTEDLKSKGLRVSAVTTYSNEESYGSSMLRCPGSDKRLKGEDDKEYIRLVFTTSSNSTTCGFPNGTEVVVVVAKISKVDAQLSLLRTAQSQKVSVILGLPGQSLDASIPTVNLTSAYLSFTERVLADQKVRYVTQYSSLIGYYLRDEVDLANDNISLLIHNVFTPVASLVHDVGKKLLVTADINLNMLMSNKTISNHVEGFSKLSNWMLNKIDIIAVHEGRGFGRGGLYWSTQRDTSIKDTDPTLFQILQKQFKTINDNTTFDDVFSGSIHELFGSLNQYKDKNPNSSELWLVLESFEDLTDDPCLPVDQTGSGISVPMDRTSKTRLDYSLTSSGAAIHKVMAFAYDPDFTCTTKKYDTSLADDILQDLGKPIISNCSFHSSMNRSVVIIGYNLDAETQGFQVNWPDRDGHRHRDHTYGYYFELDYGEKHGLVPSLMYTQLYDPYDVTSLADYGYVTVQADNSYLDCQFEFDFGS